MMMMVTMSFDLYCECKSFYRAFDAVFGQVGRVVAS